MTRSLQILRDEGVEVVYLEDLMAEVLDDISRASASKFLKQFIVEAGIRTDRYQKIILRLPERQLRRTTRSWY